MDPNATLRDIRLAVANIERHDDSADPETLHLCDLWNALDDWLSGGGFLPRDWQAKDAAVEPILCNRGD